VVSWADHDHRGDYAAAGHSHPDYAGVLHRHRHDEAAIERLEAALHHAQSRISRLEETIARLAGALDDIRENRVRQAGRQWRGN
jgi:hypothetical protein